MVERAERLAGAQRDDPAGAGRASRMRCALGFGIADRDTIIVALAGFLLRGGIVLLLVPISVLPSVIGIAGATGVDAFGIDGRPTFWLFEMVAIFSALSAVWLLLAFLVGSLIDIWLIEAAIDPAGQALRRSRSLPDLRIVLDLAAIRAVCVVPLVLAIVWASSRIYDAAYVQLTTPTNLATPLPVRVVESSADAFVVIGLVWLASEVVAAVAVRRLVLLDPGVPRSIVGALVQVVRRPISTVSTVVVFFGASVAAIGLAMAATATVFDWIRVAARTEQPLLITLGLGPLSATRDFRPAVFMLATAALGVTWLVTLAIAGVASAWRSAAFTVETAAALSETQTASAAEEGPGRRQ
ncbi:MAG: hypothetical protein ABSG37_01850 [Candidatus Limnocylindrales bacterium]